MSKAAKIDLTKGTKSELFKEISEIRYWDGGCNYEIIVVRANGESYDTIDNVENEILQMDD